VNRVGYGPNFLLNPAQTDPIARDHPLSVHNVRTPDAGQKATREKEVEIEGRLTRSLLTRHHRPYTQWERYRHWAFHVEPMQGFKHLVGQGDRQKPKEERTKHRRALRLYEREVPTDLQFPTSVECLIDPATFSRPPGDRNPYVQQYYPSIFFDQKWPFWPQTGDWFWCAGRYVYDCTHATFERTNDDDKGGLHATAINPIKAFAVARYEADRYPGFDMPVPAVKFLFFASRRGGYWDFDRDMPMNESDYEFAVDLPPLPNDTGEYAVGKTPEFKFNTLVVRPRLLQRIEFGPFEIEPDQALEDEKGVNPGRTARWWNGTPIIELGRAAPGKLPRMVKIKAPTSQMPTNQDFYCFMVSLGWYSPETVSRVKKVVVHMPHFHFLNKRFGNLRPNIGINGRWIYYPIFEVTKGAGPIGATDIIGGANVQNAKDVIEAYHNVQDGRQNWPPNGKLTLELPIDAKVTITVNGTRRNSHGEFMERKPTWDKDSGKDRRLFVGGLIDLSPEAAEAIRTIIRTKIGDIIPTQYWQNHPQVIDTLDNDDLRRLLSQAANDLIGQRRLVEWLKDVDAAGPNNNTHVVASAVAREMYLYPTGSADKPMGFIDGPPAGTHVSVAGGPFKEQDDTKVLHTTPMAMLVPGIQGPRTHGVNYRAVVTDQIDHTAFSWFDVKNGGEPDYGLDCTITVSDVDPPADKNGKPS
jgi:hypothetical protein